MNLLEGRRTGEMTLKGRSMYPSIQPGSHLKVELFHRPQPLTQQTVGDVMLGRENGEWVAHRIVTHKNNHHFKGDWSHVSSNSKDLLIWGRVLEVNGTNTFCSRSDIAKISALDLIADNIWFHYFRKMSLFLYIRIITFFRRKRL